MKKMLKKVAMMVCALVLTVGFVGGGSLEADAAAKTVTCTYKVDASMGSAAGTVASSSRSYTVYLESSTGSSIKLGTATKKLSKYALSGSSKLTMNSGATEKLRIKVVGKDHQGKTRTWRSGYATIKASKSKKTFKIRGDVDSPSFSIN